MGFLLVQGPGGPAPSVELRDGFRMGRDPACDLCLTDAGVSRLHAEILAHDNGFAIVDQESRHGVFVNDEKVERRVLGEGDRIRVGSTILTFRTNRPDDLLETVHRRETSVEPVRPEGNTPEAKRLRLLYDVSRAVGELGDPADLLRTMMRAILEVLGCERCVVGFCDGTTTTRQFVHTRDGKCDNAVVVSATLLNAILVKRDTVLVRDATDVGTPPTVIRQRIRSAMGTPLGTRHRQYGYLYVDDRGVKDRFGPDDVDFLVALARLTATALDGAEVVQRLVDETELLKAECEPGELLGNSEPMHRVRAVLDKYAVASSSVLVLGESGTGKELAARALHARSPRADHPFVAVNCAAIPDTMIESELFGHEKGAFTGAFKQRRGKFVLANQGTLFLDEVGDLSLSAQAKLLRVIQEGEVQPLGAERTIAIDVRIVSATHKDLNAEIAAGRFREDLFYRLAVVELEMPPLRERGADIVLLAKTFLERASKRMGKRIEGITDAAVHALGQYAWPGNLRQLANEMERVAILADSPIVDTNVLSTRITSRRAANLAPTSAAIALDTQYAQLEQQQRSLVENALRAVGGNQSEAARLLGVTRIVLRGRLERLGISATPEMARARRDPSEISDDELVEALRIHNWRSGPAAVELGISRSTLYVLLDRSSKIRKAKDIPEAELRGVYVACDRDVDATACELRVSRRALKLRLSELGLKS
jgi:Nif-specific regulatory protein